MDSYTYSFTAKRTPAEVFEFLAEVRNWWSGFYDETITGDSRQLEETFLFSAGNGAHRTKQKLIEFIPGKRIVWEVVESNLSFLENTNEWVGTQLVFDILKRKSDTQVVFTHKGLETQIECYTQCSSAWKQYLDQLKAALNRR